MPSPLTFLFTDIEGSTQRWERFPEEMRRDLAHHDALLRQAIGKAGGRVFKTVGDAFYAVFDSVPAATRAAVAIQHGLAAATFVTGPIKVRIAIHPGEAEPREGDFFGPTLNRVARILSAGHGGQVLLSSAAREALAPAQEVVDLGERRLKDLSRPERIFQLVAPGLLREFPPLRTLDARPNRLPAQPNAFIGRRAQLREARAVLMAPSTRLLTLTGPGGTGKSRLALQLATDSLDGFEDGVFFVPLASVRESAQVPVAVIAGLGAPVREIDELLHWSSRRELLVVLDNFEQVLEAAPFVSRWLEAAPRLKVVVTSRARLKLAGEHDWPVSALDTGEPAGAQTTSEAVQLFVDRARAARPDFALTPQNAGDIVELCRRLDGLPLAIELAAARVRLLPPRAMLQKIRSGNAVLPLLNGGGSDLPGRQQALRRTIEWSYQLLSEADRAALRAFSIFSGGADLEAATAVLGPEALERLESLVDGSLVQMSEVQDQPRFTILETVREFAHDALAAAGEEAAASRRHAEHFLAFSRSALEVLRSGARNADLTPVDREQGNLRAALRWAARTGERGLHRGLCEALWPFWEVRGQWDEGRAALAEALSPGDAAEGPAPAGLYLAAGALASTQGDFADAEPLLAHALEAFRAAGDTPRVASTLRRLAFSAAYLGEYARAETLLEEARALLERLDAGADLIETLALLGWVAAEREDFARGRALFGEAGRIAKRLGDLLALIHVNNGLGEIARGLNELDLAVQQYETALAASRELGNRRWIASALGNLGDARLRQGRLAEACEMFSESLALNVELGNRRNLPSLVVPIAAVALAEGEPRAAARFLRSAELDLADKKIRLPFADQRELERVRDALLQIPAGEREAGYAEAAQLPFDQILPQCGEVLERALRRANARVAG